MQEPTALRAEIHSTLLDRLTTNHWRPGEHLSIDGLARELNVSPTPVREAMVALERTGLVNYRAKRGYIVAPPLDRTQISQLIEARLVMERAALSKAISTSWLQFSQTLREAQERQRRAAASAQEGDHIDYSRLREYLDADITFHRAFFEYAENEFLSAMHEGLGGHAHRMRQSLARGREFFDFPETLSEHEQILMRVEERNHDGALAALERHLMNVRDRFGAGGTAAC